MNKALGWDKDDDLSLSTEGINAVERQTVTNVPSISGGKNQSQYGKPFPFVMGKSLYTPMYIGKPYTTISGVDGEDEEFHALYVCGYNDIQISDIKLGNTLLSSNKEKITSGLLNIDSTVYPTSEYQTKIEVQDSDEVSLYPQKVIQQDFNIELINNYTSSTNQYFLQLDRFSSVFPQTVEVEFSIGGLLAYNNEGSVEISVKVAIEYSKDGGETWLPFAKIGEGQSGISYYADGSVQGVIKTDSGDKVFNGVSVIKRNKAKQMRFVARKTFSYNDVMNFDGNCTLTNNCIEFRIVRINGSYESGINQGVSGYNLQSPSDTVYLSSIRTWSFDRVESAKQKTLVPQRPIVESKRKRLTRLGFSIMAKETLKGTLDSFNCIVQSKGRIWDKYTGTWSTTVEPTQNPASIALLVLQSCMRGDINAANYIYDDSRIDLESFGKFYEWCDERGYYNSQDLETIRFACNGVLVSQKKTSDILKSVLSCGRGVLVLNGKKYGVFIDKPRDITVMILNNQNILAASNTKTFDEIPDKFECAFVDERNNYSQDTGYAYLDESKRKTDVGDLKAETLALPYQTNWYQVWANLRYNLACRKLRPETWSFTIGIEGNLLEYGDLVEVQSDSLLVGIGDGCQITNLIFDETNSYITGIETDGDFDVADASARYGVKIMETDVSNNLEPKILTKEVTFSGTSGISKFEFVEPISLNELQLPYAEDIVAFGLYDRITSKGIVTSIKPDGEGRFSLVLVPYDEDVFKADNKDYVDIPDFDSKLTPIIAVNRGGTVSSQDLEDLKNTLNSSTSSIIQGISDGSIEIGNPDKPLITAKANENGIHLVASPLSNGLKNVIVKVMWYISKDSGEHFVLLTSSGDTEYDYSFNRLVDGYPELNDFNTWKFKAIVYNQSGHNTESDLIDVDTSSYGTYELSKPTVFTRISDRSVSLVISEPSRADNKKVYGTIKYKIQVRKPGIDGEDSFYKPATSSDPYDSEMNYKDGDGFVISDGYYTQIMPLTGQESDDISDTLYQFKVVAYNESKESDSEVVNAIALCTSIKDIVKANETSKSSYIQNLTALQSAFGFISSGVVSGKVTDKSNYWTLNSDVVDNDENNIAYKGAFRIGGDDQYLLVIPQVNEKKEITGYQIDFKVGNFNVTSTNTNFEGEFIVQDPASPLDRIQIAPDGIFLQHRDYKGGAWYVVNQFDTSGIIAPSLKAKNQIIIGNFEQTTARQTGHDIGRPYLTDEALVWHFDDDFYSQNGKNDGLVFDGVYTLKGTKDSTGIDFTPAIHAVAPYCTMARCCYGQYSLNYTVNNTNVLTVDFWQQYLYAESQELFNIGSDVDKIVCQVLPSEVEAVISGVCTWKNKNVYRYTSTRNPKIGDMVYTTYAAAEEKGESNLFITSIIYNDDFTVAKIIVNDVEYIFETGDPDANWETFAPEEEWGDTSCLALRADNKKTVIKHIGLVQTEEFMLDDYGYYFNEYTWEHIGVVFTETKIKFLYNDFLREFTRFSTSLNDMNISLNSLKTSVILDELYIDKAVELTQDFIENTSNRIPWAKLDKNKDWFVFDAKDVSLVKSNIFDYYFNKFLNSDELKNRIQDIVGE